MQSPDPVFRGTGEKKALLPGITTKDFNAANSRLIHWKALFETFIIRQSKNST